MVLNYILNLQVTWPKDFVLIPPQQADHSHNEGEHVSETRTFKVQNTFITIRMDIQTLYTAIKSSKSLEIIKSSLYRRTSNYELSTK